MLTYQCTFKVFFNVHGFAPWQFVSVSQVPQCNHWSDSVPRRVWFVCLCVCSARVGSQRKDYSSPHRLSPPRPFFLLRPGPSCGSNSKAHSTHSKNTTKPSLSKIFQQSKPCDFSPGSTPPLCSPHLLHWALAQGHRTFPKSPPTQTLVPAVPGLIVTSDGYAAILLPVCCLFMCQPGIAFYIWKFSAQESLVLSSAPNIMENWLYGSGIFRSLHTN